MEETFITEENILKNIISDWKTVQLIEGTEYKLFTELEGQFLVEDPNQITLLRTKDSVKISLGLESSTKVWTHLFSLPSYITAQQEVISSSEYLSLFDSSIEEPTNMYISYGVSVQNYENVSEIIQYAEKIVRNVKEKTIENLIKKAKDLL